MEISLYLTRRIVSINNDWIHKVSKYDAAIFLYRQCFYFICLKLLS